MKALDKHNKISAMVKTPIFIWGLHLVPVSNHRLTSGEVYIFDDK